MPSTGLAPGTTDLMTAARAARDALHQDGLPLTRDALAARMRAADHPLRCSGLTTPLLHGVQANISKSGRMVINSFNVACPVLDDARKRQLAATGSR